MNNNGNICTLCTHQCLGGGLTGRSFSRSTLFFFVINKQSTFLKVASSVLSAIIAPELDEKVVYLVSLTCVFEFEKIG